MVNAKMKFEWDGEKIKQEAIQEEKKHTPKDILNSLAHVKNQIAQMEGQKAQLKQQEEQVEKSLKSAKSFQSKLLPFEEKCRELQHQKLQLYVKQLTPKLSEKAMVDAKADIAKAPDAYEEGYEVRLAYLNFQKALATHKKVSENISAEIIKTDLYAEPIFKNPFKD